ncbi:MAG: ABC transporter permease [Planctomycetaceae bacterium]|jgi:oligopeptide transport system permease protein|nr:ABC transporter permease [Planctomycetaceae bacterium]MBT4725905.1 ABC transporter permease [Planctomycetaceae bacterium]MBT5123131.1 ABC transporter permease [Planctomycetaceae bacterium]MBT5598207.1 ABC transporter permease [Planctomycetaceae bacterium]MBT5883023.1 ABC transporter permease [Planctomycetaceae bacterium]
MNQTPIPTTDEQPDKSSKRMELQRLAEVMSVAQSQQGVSLWSDGWKRLKRNRVSMLSLWTLVIIVVLAIITPALPLQSPIFQDVKQRELLSPEFKTYKLGIVDYNETLALKRQTLIEMGPLDDQRAALQAEIEGLEARHPINVYWNDPGFISQAMIKFRIFIFGDYCIPSICGTDKLGRDVLSRVCWGSRVSLACGLIATLVSLLIGVSYGAISGYFGGRIDNIMMRIIDVAYSIPFIFIVIFIMSFLSAPKVRDTLNEYGINQITVFFLMIGAIYWLTMARVVRGQVLSLKNEQFVDAAKTIGTSQWGIIFKHLVPNVMGIVIVYLTLTIPAVIRFEAFLSFLGMGVQAPDISWGMLVNEGIQVITPIRIYWWMIIFSGLALALTLFSLNFLGDGVRDALDPKLKNR